MARTEKKPSVASSLINFYMENKQLCGGSQTKKTAQVGIRSWEIVGGKKPWELTADTLFLGFQTDSVRRCSTKGYENEIAVMIVDVVPEYAPEISAAKPDGETARIIMFVGETGSGKTTQINAFVSFLLGGNLTDTHRILLIDDRNLDQSKSITRYITVYRVRPLSDRFCQNTFYIIDTPGYGDTESLHTGFDRDKFITASMEVMFNTLPKMNKIILTSKSGLTRATVGITAVVTNIFQLFAKNVRQCLRTILTFSDVGTSPAIPVLRSLDWPLHSGTLVEVNNSAFRIAGADNSRDPKVMSWWKLSMEGQQEVARMLRSMEAVPTAQSAQVTHNRISLSDTCTVVEKQVLRTANETANLLRNLDSISKAIGASPGEKVKVTTIKAKQQDIPDGKHTTLCTNCNYTCHEICAIGDDGRKMFCAAMNYRHCTVCNGKCHWRHHKNARFIIVPEEVTEYVVPEDLIKKWNSTTNSLEGAAIDAMNKYIELQNTLNVGKYWDKEGALFPENLKAIVQLLKVILKTGSVTAVHSEYASN